MYHFRFLLLLLPAVALWSCKDATVREKQKPLWVATTGMIGDVLMAFAGDYAEVKVLMGPGVDPHLYKATQADLSQLRDAELIVYNGLHLEGKMGDILRKLNGKTQTIALGELLPPNRLLLADSANSTYDPHIWFDVALWRDAATLLLDTLAQVHSTDENAAAYLDTLTALHHSIMAQFESWTPNQKVLVTAHDAFGYFGRAYGFSVRGLQGISTLSDFGIRDVEQLAAFVISNRIPALFVEHSIPPRAIQSVLETSKRGGHNVNVGGELYSDALGAPDGPAGTYVGMVRHNVQTIFESLQPVQP